jgi:hypothetical protein
VVGVIDNMLKTIGGRTIKLATLVAAKDARFGVFMNSMS